MWFGVVDAAVRGRIGTASAASAGVAAGSSEGDGAAEGCASAHRDVEGHVYDRVRNFLRRRHKVSMRGTREFQGTRVFGECGVRRLRRPMPATRP